MPRRVLLAWLLALALVPLTWRPGWLPGERDPVYGTPLWARRPGLLVAIDPVTDQIVPPSAEQVRAWTLDAFRAPTRPLTVQKLPNGGEILHLNGAYRSYSIARVRPDGKVVTSCVVRELK